MHLLSFTWVSSSCAIIRAQIELVVLSTEDLIVCNSYVGIHSYRIIGIYNIYLN